MFVTDAPGFVGSAIVRELLGAGHQFSAPPRADKAAATPTDGVIHIYTAFNNISETTDFAASCQADTRAVKALGEALVGSDRPLAITSAAFPGTRPTATSASSAPFSLDSPP